MVDVCLKVWTLTQLRRDIRLWNLVVQLGLNILTKHAIFFQPSQTMYIIMTVWHLNQSYPLLKTHYYALWTWVTWCHSQQAIGWWGGRAWAQWVYRGVKIFYICSYLFPPLLMVMDSQCTDEHWAVILSWKNKRSALAVPTALSPGRLMMGMNLSLCVMGKAAQGMYSELKSMKHCAGRLSLRIKLC